jgi:hypothetical protein
VVLGRQATFVASLPLAVSGFSFSAAQIAMAAFLIFSSSSAYGLRAEHST